MRFDLRDERLRVLAKEHRRNATAPERNLWQALRQRRTGMRFRRQAPVGNWIVDFWCPRLKLAVEVDGDYHEDNRDEDERRDAGLRKMRVTVLRFTNQHVEEGLDSVLDQIHRTAEQLADNLGIQLRYL